MSTSKHIDKICCIILAVTLLLTVIFMNAQRLGLQAVSAVAGYASRLFDASMVHTIDIIMDDWDSFIENCTDEQYVDCTVVIDGEAYRNIGIRAKGNTSLSSVASYGNDRYSFKIEFDHFDDAVNYYGLDKLCLNNIIQDNTYMKDYITYQLMHKFGVDAPLCSYSYITVNGNDWGLYLAVEGVEDSFLQRNYGSNYGQLYKPDSTNMGGGRGNGRDFNMEDFDTDNFQSHSNDISAYSEKTMPTHEGDRRSFNPENGEERKGNNMSSGFGMRSSDTSLIYTDDEYDSYSNIFDNAKTNLTDADKTRLIASLKKLNHQEEIETVVDIEEVIRYFVVHNFVLNFDSYTGSLIHNYYLYEENGQFSMIPWDYNLAFGGFEKQSNATELVNYPIDTPVSGGTIDSRPMLAWIFADEKYTDLYHQYFAEFINEYFDNGYFETMIDSVKEMIDPYVQNDPTKFCTYEEFDKGVSTLKKFCLLRAESITGQLNGTIPATEDEQSQDASSFIDASDLAVSDMGSMNQMMGGPNKSGHFFEDAGQPGQRPDDNIVPPGNAPDNINPPDWESFAPKEMSPNMPGGFNPPDGINTRGNNISSLLFPLGLSGIMLFIGIATASLFQRRKNMKINVNTRKTAHADKHTT